MSLSAQAKVLRVLQSGNSPGWAAKKTTKVNVRVWPQPVDLKAAAAAGKFREDLYFRLAVVPLKAPPLRERPEDIPLLVERFMDQTCAENGFKPKTIVPAAVDLLCRYTWPGNVRELRNVVEQLVILSEDTIQVADLPEELVENIGRAGLVCPLSLQSGRCQTTSPPCRCASFGT